MFCKSKKDKKLKSHIDAEKCPELKNTYNLLCRLGKEGMEERHTLAAGGNPCPDAFPGLGQVF